MSNVRDEFKRTVCDCADCASHCYKKPGFIVPLDVAGIEDFLGRDIRDMENLFRVSTKTKVLIGDIVMPVLTITPRTKEDGSCVFLENGKCDIHPVSPYGCSHFDSHMGLFESSVRLKSGITEVMEDIKDLGPYCQRILEMNCEDEVVIRRLDGSEVVNG